VQAYAKQATHLDGERSLLIKELQADGQGPKD